MARVKRRDVVVELMDAVSRLEVTATKHADLLEAIATHAMSTSAELTAVSGRVNGLSGHLNGLSSHVNGLSAQVKDVAQRVSSLEGEFQDLAENFALSAKLSRTMQTDVGRLARILGESAGRSRERFDDIEKRIGRLEKKTG